MCRVTESETTNETKVQNDKVTKTTNNNNDIRILLTIKSFHGYTNTNLPNTISCILTMGIIILGLFLFEYFGRYILYHYSTSIYINLPEELFNNTSQQTLINQYILARHLCNDTLSCIICVLFGLSSNSIVTEIYQVIGLISKKIPIHLQKTSTNDKQVVAKYQPMDCTRYYERLETFEAGGYRLSLFFMSYMIKNTYDSIIWNDGPEFLFHHLFSILTAYGSIFSPSIGHFYTIFFFGLSEFSTAILCCLANFDDVHGIIGLATYYPITKIIFAILFTISFIVFRCLLWPVFAYYFCSDVVQALKEQKKVKGTSAENKRRHLHNGWMFFFLISLSGISVLQVLWLGQIFILGKQELVTMGIL